MLDVVELVCLGMGFTEDLDATVKVGPMIVEDSAWYAGPATASSSRAATVCWSSWSSAPEQSVPCPDDRAAGREEALNRMPKITRILQRPDLNGVVYQPDPIRRNHLGSEQSRQPNSRQP